MATVQVILHGMPGGSVHDTADYPIVLEFDDSKAYEQAQWIVPSFPEEIPAYMLSEIRILEGKQNVVVEGPEGFQSGPHATTWVRSSYPRGKDCALLEVNADTHKMNGVTVEVVEGSLIIGELALGGTPST
jgi:hypothetical protein